MLPAERAEPVVRGSAGGMAFRGTVYALLGLAVACGAWMRFNTQVTEILPGLAAPGAAAPAQTGKVSGLLELALVPAGEADAAVAGMALSGGEAALLRAALRDRRLRLVSIELADETAGSEGS